VRKFSVCGDLLLHNEAIHSEGTGDRPFISEFRNTPFFKEYHEFWKTGKSLYLRYILSLCTFLKKMRYEREDLDQVSFRDWSSVEGRLTDVALGEDYVSDLNTIVKTILPLPDMTYFYPKHGPGTVAGGAGKSVDKKHRNFGLDAMTERMLKALVNPIDDAEGYLTDFQSPKKIVTKAEVLFVPKDMFKTRSICREPIQKQFLQQGLLVCFINAIQKGYLGRFVNINDQTRNQRLAYDGSVHLCLDTIDLSAASDSVGWDLVKRVFPVSWVRLFAATRSSEVTYKGQTIKIRKFAPMGSAVCFPTQCVIFTSIVILAYLRYKHGRLSGFSSGDIISLLEELTNNPYERKLLDFAVYGDDILCDTRVTEDVLQILEGLRFEVNREKSFMASALVRESCGKYYHSGNDITPHRYTIPFYGKEGIDERVVASFVGNANQAYEFGYSNLRRFYIYKALRSKLKQRDERGLRGRCGTLRIPFVGDRDLFGIFSEGVISNGHLTRRYDSHLQRSYWRSLGIGARNVRIVEIDKHERYSLNLYWRIKMASANLVEFDHASYLPQATRWKWGWTPTS
jgi:hypothetical protein